MLPSYWNRGELYMKNAMAYEAMQTFRYYGRVVHENQINETEQTAALELAMKQGDGFEQDGMLAKHVRVPFAGTPSRVVEAIIFLDRKLDEYEDTENPSGVQYRIKTYRDELERQHPDVSDQI
jgi:hypothetical protein